jgi:tetratricopeptide (TPR) repeat protein
VAASLNNLATLYDAQGLFPQAEPLYQRSLAIREKALRPEHLDVAASLGNLAGLYQVQRQYEKAEPLLKRALAIREKALPPGHADIVATQRSLWALYTSRGEYALAELYAAAGQVTPSEQQNRRLAIPIPSAGRSAPK